MAISDNLLFRQNPHPMFRYDPDTLRINDANNAAIRQYGYSRDELLELTIRDLFFPDDLPLLDQQLERDHRRIWETDTHRHQTRSGRVIYVQAVSQPYDVEGAARQRLVSIFNVSELVQTRTDYQQLFHTLNDLLFLVDPQSGRLLDANDHALQHLGIQRGSVSELFVSDLLFSRSDKKPLKPEHLQTGPEATCEAFLLKSGGGRLFLQIRSNFSHFKGQDVLVVAAHDMTERYWAERALKQSEERLFEFMEHASILIHLTGLDGNLIYANSTWRKALGYDSNEVFELSIVDLAAPECKEDVREIISRLREGDVIEDFETVFLTNSGERMHLEGNASHRRKQGHPSYTSWFLKDITKRKKSERQVQESLKEKEILLAEIHHRVKNNLALINGLLELQTEFLDDESGIKALRQSQARVYSMAMVHEQLYQDELVTQLDLRSYLNNILPLLQQRYQISDADNPLHIELQAEEVLINLNQAVTCGLLLNELLNHAFEHAYHSGRRGRLVLNISQQDDEVILSARDHGLGINEAVQMNHRDSMVRLLVITLVEQLNGHFELGNRKGTHMLIRFKKQPLPPATGS